MDLTSESVTSAVIAFGFKLNWRGELQKIAKNHLKRAVQVYREGGYEAIVVCGYYPLNDPHMDIFCEADVMEAWLHEFDPSIPVLKERLSRCSIERWLYLRRNFPKLRKMCLVVRKSALKRQMFFARLVYGKVANRLTYEVLLWRDGREARETSLLRAAQCLYGHIKLGRYDKLFNEDGTTKVEALAAAHDLTCSPADGVHP
ncbi:MAG TPA: ElyC/SanA/YdcF family protein [Candidatus Saccharimonadales bacterium]